MARQPKPWYWKARGAWYVQLGGKQVRLAEDKKSADREFYRVMAADGRLDQRQRDRMTVADACEAMIANSQHLRARTKELYLREYGLFADSRFGSRPLTSVTPEEVIRWLESHVGTGRQPFGDASRSLVFRYIKTLYRWARDTGIIQINQFSRSENPWIVQQRVRAMTEEEYVAIMSRTRISKEMREVVEFVWRTGIRPGELAVMSARHLDVRLPIARFQSTEHKTGRRTGLTREVNFPVDLWERIQGYAQKHKAGPLVRRHNGSKWTGVAISIYFNRIKKSMGLTCVLYHARHRFISALLDSGVPEARVAKLAGHNNVNTVMKTYYHPDAGKMVDDVNAIDNSAVDKIAEKVEAKRHENRVRDEAYQKQYRETKRAAKKKGGPASGT